MTDKEEVGLKRERERGLEIFREGERDGKLLSLALALLFFAFY